MAQANAPYLDYAVWWSPEDNAYLAHAVAMPGTVTHGDTPEQALAGAIEVARGWLELGKHAPARSLSARDVDAAGAPTWSPDDIRGIRQNFAVSQAVFADMLNVDLGTVRSWEQGIRSPSGPSARLLEVAATAPGVFWRNVLRRDGVSAIAR